MQFDETVKGYFFQILDLQQNKPTVSIFETEIPEISNTVLHHKFAISQFISQINSFFNDLGFEPLIL